MPVPNTPLLSSAFSPRHRAQKIKASPSLLLPLPILPTNPAAMDVKQDRTTLSTGQIWNKKRVSDWKRSQSNALFFFSSLSQTQMFYFILFSKTSSVPCSLPLCFHIYSGLDSAQCLLRAVQTCHQSCSSILAGRGVARCAKRGYSVAESLYFQG